MGIGPDTELELLPDDGGLRLEAVRSRLRAVDERDELPILAMVEGAVVTDDDVRRWRDDVAR